MLEDTHDTSNQEEVLDSLAKYGPKISTVYVKLQDYEYFHTSSNPQKKDDRIIGRLEIKNKLEQILVHDQTKSGTYLITGSRGMGKTSLVNEVLRKVRNKKDLDWRKVLRLLWVAVGLTLVILSFSKIFLFSTPLFVIKFFETTEGRLGQQLFLILCFLVLVAFGNLTKSFFNGGPKSIWRSLLAIIFFLFLFHYFYFSCSQYFETWALAILGYFILFVIIYSIHGLNPTSQKSHLIKIWRTWKLRSQDVLTVNLDIGQEDISDLDVLKQIVSDLRQTCRQARRNFYFLRVGFLWIIALTIGYMFSIGVKGSEVFNELQSSAVWTSYFPSQKKFGSTQSQLFQLKKVETYHSELLKFRLDSLQKEVGKNLIPSTDSVKIHYESGNPEPVENIGWLLININNSIKGITHLLDESLQLMHALFHPRGNPKKPLSDPLNYLEILVVLLLALMSKLVMTIVLRSQRPYFIDAIRYLDQLTNRIYAETTDISSAGLVRNQFFNWNRRRTHTRPIAGKYEIQTELQYVIEVMNKGAGLIPFWPINRQIVFVMDELDKIEPEYDTKHFEPSARNGHRETRQERITRMLQSLKSFFNSTKAKFIFIAGDDMYDAAVADASNNREHSVDRLFNKVFYVPSFYSDDSDRRKSNINSMTESYICQFLLPKNENDSEVQRLAKTNLKSYYARFFDSGSPLYLYFEEGDSHVHEARVTNLMRVKVMYTLLNFTTYLAYQSNGSPKKITSLFEDYIVKPKNFSSEFGRFFVTDDERLDIENAGFYLRFTEEDQYKFGLINYLVTPFYISQKRYLKSFSDKLLVSSSFIVDHLYKYHNNAFSWRTLELTPEIIAVSKAPQLRNFIKDIMHYFTQTHVDRITSGLYDFKFIGKVKNEIKYLSKVSDLEAAAFNFTLDESRQSKIHYKSKLQELRQVYQNRISNSKEDDQKFIHSLALSNMILGDLEYYDQEYDDAIIYYMDAIQELRYLVRKKSENYMYNFVVYLRNALKLGLTFEKQNNYDSALMTYDGLKREILALRNFNVKELGFQEVEVTKDTAPAFIKKQLIQVGPEALFEAFVKFHQDNASINLTSFLKENRSLEERITKIFGESSTEAIKDEIGKWYKALHDSAAETHSEWVGLVKTDLLKIKDNDSLKNVTSRPEIEVVIALFLRLFQDRTRITVVLKENGHFYSFQAFHFISRFLNEPISDEGLIRSQNKLFVFENLRLLYQPFMASLSILEKNGINSITNTNIKRTLEGFDFISHMLNVHKPYMIEVEFLNKLGDILYFKNGMLKNALLDSNNQPMTKQTFAKKQGVNIPASARRDYNLPVQGTIFYLLAINSFWQGIESKDQSNRSFYQGDEGNRSIYYSALFAEIKKEGYKENYINDLIKEQLLKALEFLNDGVSSPKYTNPRSIKINTLANCYSDLGNAILSSICVDAIEQDADILGEKLDTSLELMSILNRLLFSRYEKEPDKDLLKDFEDILDQLPVKAYSLEYVFMLYFISSAFYHKTYKNLKAAFQIQKIITLIDDSLFLQGLTNRGKKDRRSWSANQLNEPRAKSILFKIEELLLLPFVTKVNKAYKDSLWQDMANYKTVSGLSGKELNEDVLRAQEVTEIQLVESGNSRQITNPRIVITRWPRNWTFFSRIKKKSAFIIKLMKVVRLQNSIWISRTKPYFKIYQAPKTLNKAYDEKKSQFEKYRNDLLSEFNKEDSSKERKPNIDFEFHKNSSIASDQKEVYFLLVKIKIRLGQSKIKDQTLSYKNFASSILSHPYSDNSNQLNRVHELFLRGTQLKNFYQKQLSSIFGQRFSSLMSLYSQKRKFLAPDEGMKAEFKKIFVDSVYCYNEIISKLNVMEASFQTPNIYFGFAHYELSFWLEELEKVPDLQYEVLKAVSDLSGDIENDFLNKQYQWAKAKYHFVTAMQTHSGMDPYIHTINNMYYLDDDFNDDQEHFYAAQERFHINSGVIKTICTELSRKLDNADRLFGSDFYTADFVGQDSP